MKKDNTRSDLFLEGGRVLNVYTGEILEANVAVKGEKIYDVGPDTGSLGQKTIRLDMTGKTLVPGYVEPHCHPWDTYNPLSFGEEACRLGTTTLVCDDLTFFLLMGVDRFEAFMDALTFMPIKFFWFVRLMPQTPMEDEAALFKEENLKRLLGNPLVLSVGEITRWHELLEGNPKILNLIRFARRLGKRVDGHTAGAKYEKLAVISRAGVESCHESINDQEVLERLRLGLHVMLRHSSLRQDLRTLLKGIQKAPLSVCRVMLTTDGSTPAFQLNWGMTDRLVKIAMEEGIDPVAAYRMVTLNPAVYFGLEDRIGGIAPGRDADILVLADLRNPTPETVISKGRIMAQKGALLSPFPKIDWHRFLPETAQIRCDGFAKADYFRIPINGKSNGQTVPFPVVKFINPVITRVEEMQFPVQNGYVDVPLKEGFSLVATLNRRGRWVANGILKGFADKVDGIASTFNTAAEIVVMGRQPEAMAMAVNRVLEMGGGIVAVEKGKTAYEFPLPLGGMMSERPFKELADKDNDLQEFLSKRGFKFHDPLYTFIFIPNDFLPDVRINRKGVVNIKNGRILWPARRLP